VKPKGGARPGQPMDQAGAVTLGRNYFSTKKAIWNRSCEASLSDKKEKKKGKPSAPFQSFVGQMGGFQKVKGGCRTEAKKRGSHEEIWASFRGSPKTKISSRGGKEIVSLGEKCHQLKRLWIFRRSHILKRVGWVAEEQKSKGKGDVSYSACVAVETAKIPHTKNRGWWGLKEAARRKKSSLVRHDRSVR